VIDWLIAANSWLWEVVGLSVALVAAVCVGVGAILFVWAAIRDLIEP
jgi:hypothetical protein